MKMKDVQRYIKTNDSRSNEKLDLPVTHLDPSLSDLPSTAY